MKAIILKETWLTDHISISEISKLCQEIEHRLKWLNNEKSQLKAFYSLTDAAFGLINNPYSQMQSDFDIFETVISPQCDTIKEKIIMYIADFSDRQKKPKVKLSYFLNEYDICSAEVFKYHIKNFNISIISYKHALNSRNQILKDACHLKETDSYIMKQQYFNSNYSETIAFLTELDVEDKNEHLFEIKTYKLVDWCLRRGKDRKSFSQIKYDKFFEDYLKEHYAEEYI